MNEEKLIISQEFKQQYFLTYYKWLALVLFVESKGMIRCEKVIPCKKK